MVQINPKIKDRTTILSIIRDGITTIARIKGGERALTNFQVSTLIKIWGKIQLKDGVITRIKADLIKAQHLVRVIKAIQVTHGALQTVIIGTIHLE